MNPSAILRLRLSCSAAPSSLVLLCRKFAHLALRLLMVISFALPLLPAQGVAQTDNASFVYTLLNANGNNALAAYRLIVETERPAS